MSNKRRKNSKGLHARKRQAVDGVKLTPASEQQTTDKLLVTRKIRHYQPETLHIIQQSMTVVSATMDGIEKDKAYSQAVDAIKQALSELADTLTAILTEDPNTDNEIHHHDLLAHYFHQPGTDENGIHLVATSNIEALSEDLNLAQNTREYNWLMNNGIHQLEYEILNRISQEMSLSEGKQTATTYYQHERALEIQDILEKTNF
ncbi:hypothetical protein [Candidatus Sororendozoicomonas aggregata]|uniref:hypothetical protein n=1 Tax=Candidatus Sororendozoicomonas aggregata TaxID=3073239 RepID=UPI002ED31BB9